MIDAVALGPVPKVAVVATLTSVMPAVPYVFRSYELPPGSEAEAARIAAYTGSSRFSVWQVGAGLLTAILHCGLPYVIHGTGELWL
jgi:hypothetical protein